VSDKHVGLAEGPLVKQQFQALAGGEPTPLVLSINSFGPSGLAGLTAEVLQVPVIGISIHERFS
jgi:hypothetical protein